MQFRLLAGLPCTTSTARWSSAHLASIERHFSFEEYAVIDEEAIKRLSLRQLRFTVPWFMAMLPEDVAAASRAEAPVALRVIWHLCRRSYARLVRDAFGA